jgi:hypothetical protein
MDRAADLPENQDGATAHSDPAGVARVVNVRRIRHSPMQAGLLK